MQKIACPHCRYCPLDERRYCGGDYPSEDIYEQADCFDVLGADEGFVICPDCACEFDWRTGTVRDWEE